jgi:hypothetical protein
MKIKYKTRAAGPDGTWNIGDVADIPVDKARQLVTGGYAEALEPFPQAAPKPAPEPTQQTAKGKPARK